LRPDLLGPNQEREANLSAAIALIGKDIQAQTTGLASVATNAAKAKLVGSAAAAFNWNWTAVN